MCGSGRPLPVSLPPPVAQTSKRLGRFACRWTVPTRRSVTWLVYLNDEWQANEGGALRTYPRAAPAAAPVGAHMGNLQVGWIGGTLPVFLDAATRDDGLLFLYSCGAGGLVTLLSDAFPMPPKPVEFGRFISKAPPGTDFEQISTARLDPRFAGNGAEPLRPSTQLEPLGQLDILPVGGTLVLFDSVTLPHQVGLSALGLSARLGGGRGPVLPL